LRVRGLRGALTLTSVFFGSAFERSTTMVEPVAPEVRPSA
jgi:hypothetical protein